MRPLFVVALLLIFGAPACSYYSFTGASIPEGLDTIAIPLVEDNSATNPFPDLDSQLTDLLVSRFVGQTRLRLEQNENDADALLRGRIVSYDNEPTAVSGDEPAQLNRVTIRVSVLYRNQNDDKDLLERTFSGTAEYDPVAEGQQGESDAAVAAIENVADDIFSAATSNW